MSPVTEAEALEDIHAETANAAFQHTSWTPERRGASACRDYAAALLEDQATLQALATTPEKQEVLAREFPRFRERCAAKYTAWLQAHGRCASAMITGPSNFPTKRNQQRNDVERKRLEEYMDARKRGVKAIRKALTPELQPVMAGDSDAVGRLTAKIEAAEAEHAGMKAVNKAHKAFLKDPASLASSDLSEAMQKLVREYEPAYSWEPHPFPPYALQNSSANLRRMKKRLEELKVTKATPDTVKEVDDLRVEDCPGDNRVRLFFPGKPDDVTRTQLKSNGFRWAPSQGCWQAYRNTRSALFVDEFIARWSPQ